MQVTINRLCRSKTCVISTVEVNGVPKYYGLEPVNAVPAGTYPLVPYDSPKHHKRLPLVDKIPGHSGVEVHLGNTPANSRGCLLLGMTVDVDFVGHSQIAIDDFYGIFFAAVAKGEKCVLTYKDIAHG